MKEVTFALAVCTIAGAAFSAELRTWTVRSSVTHEIDAEFVVARGNRVILKTADGREVAVPIDRLSAADGAYVRRRQGADRPAFHAPRVPVVELIGISVDKPIPRVEESVLMASTAGMSVRFLVMTDLHVVSMPRNRSPACASQGRDRSRPSKASRSSPRTAVFSNRKAHEGKRIRVHST